MNINAEVSSNIELCEWIGTKINGLAIPHTERAILAASCFHIAIEHHRSIVLLISRQMHGSAFALVRLLFESFIRGLWLQNCASDKEIAQYKKDKLDLKFSKLLEAVESTPGWDGGELSAFKTEFWGALNSFTHSGILQSSRRYNGHGIESDYSNEDIVKALHCSGSWGLLTSIAMAGIAENINIATDLLEKAKMYGNQAPA